MAQCENRALTDLRVAGSNRAGQLFIYFHNVFSSSYKNSMSTCKSSSQVPHQSFRAQTAALLTPAFGPPGHVYFGKKFGFSKSPLDDWYFSDCTNLCSYIDSTAV